MALQMNATLDTSIWHTKLSITKTCLIYRKMKFGLSSKFCHRENRALVGDHTAPLTEKGVRV